MKKFSLLIPIFFYCILVLDACKKNPADENSNTDQPVIPDLSTQVNSTVAGFITDENGSPVEAATVTGGAATAATDAYGYFKISNTGFAKSAGFVKVTRPGYFTAIRTFLPVSGQEAFIRLQLIPKTIAGTISAAAGGTVSTADGSSVTLPANGVVVASGNAAYTGNINVAMHWLDPSAETTQQTMPGDLRAIDASGYLKGLTTYGMLAIELTSDAGELLQIGNGQKASLNFPLPASIQNTAPNTIPLWYFDESNGLWKEEGQAIKAGNNYKGDVGHFTYWNCDVPYPLVNFSARILDRALHPLANIPVAISINGVSNSTHICFTDGNGVVHGMIPANAALTLKIGVVCNTSIYSQNFTTTNSDLDLGNIQIDLQQFGGVLNGVVNNCSGAPVANGYVIFASGATNQVAEIVNGSFNVAAIICPGTSGYMVAFDRQTGMQSILQNITLATGVNDFGTISACNIFSGEYITYILDGVATALTGSQYDFTAEYMPNNGPYTGIHAYDLQNNNFSMFGLSVGGTDVGPHQTGPPTVFGNPSNTYVFNGTQQILITSYGAVGEFITGNFNCSVHDLLNNDNHTLSCSFSILRDQ